MKSLTTRVALLTAAVAVITAVIAGLLGFGLLYRADSSRARQTLSRVATEVADGSQSPAMSRIALRALRVTGGTIGPAGAVNGPPLARTALSRGQIQQVLAGRSVSATTHADGSTVLVEARPTDRGGIVVVQRQADALSLTARAGRRLLIALIIAVATAVLLGVLVARRLARPLRRTASAALALAAGERQVAVRVEGPTEVADVAAAVNSLAEHLSASEARQRDFLLSVSHDLRTPLTAITGYAESLADGLLEPADLPRVGQVMTAEARRLDRLVSDLLDLARLEAQDLRVEFAAVDLDALLLAAGQVWSDRCASAGVHFEVRTEVSGLTVRTDAARLRQVLDGLLENALRVTPTGRPIVVESRCADRAVVEVRDGGPGLTDDDLRVAFNRSALFERYRGVRQVGTGLGLAIVHRLCDRLDAQVSAGHAAEGGACFRVEIPYATRT